MFDFGFSEILIIALAGLFIIGPERLPGTMRFLAHLFRRIRAQIKGVRDDIDREMQLEDMKSIHRELSGMKADAEKAVHSVVRGFSEEAKKTEAELKSAGENPPDEKKTTPKPTAWPGASSSPAPAKERSYAFRRDNVRLLELLRNTPKEDEAEVGRLLRELSRKFDADESSRKLTG